MLTRSDSSPPPSRPRRRPPLSPPAGVVACPGGFFAPIRVRTSSFVRLTGGTFVSRHLPAHGRFRSPVGRSAGRRALIPEIYAGRLFGAVVAFSRRAAGDSRGPCGFSCPRRFLDVPGCCRMFPGVPGRSLLFSAFLGVPCCSGRFSAGFPSFYARPGSDRAENGPAVTPRSESAIHNRELVHRHEPPARPSAHRRRRWGQFPGGPVRTDLPDPWRFRGSALPASAGPPAPGDR